MIKPKPPVFFMGGTSMFMIREILGYCIISAVCLLGMAVIYSTRLLFAPKPSAAGKAARLLPVRGLCYHRPGGDGHCWRVQNSRGRPLAEPGSLPGLSRDLGDARAEKDRPNCRECRDVCPPGRYDAGGLSENVQLWENRSFPGTVLLCH